MHTLSRSTTKGKRKVRQLFVHITYSLAHLTHTPSTTIFLTFFVLRTTDKVLERIPSAVQNLTIIAVCPILVVV